MKLKHTGNGYSGIDPEHRGIVECGHGDIVEVSESKAYQLVTDFPGEWEEVEERPRRGDKPNHTKPAEPEVLK